MLLKINYQIPFAFADTGTEMGYYGTEMRYYKAQSHQRFCNHYFYWNLFYVYLYTAPPSPPPPNPIKILYTQTYSCWVAIHSYIFFIGTAFVPWIASKFILNFCQCRGGRGECSVYVTFAFILVLVVPMRRNGWISEGWSHQLILKKNFGLSLFCLLFDCSLSLSG